MTLSNCVGKIFLNNNPQLLFPVWDGNVDGYSDLDSLKR